MRWITLAVVLAVLGIIGGKWQTRPVDAPAAQIPASQDYRTSLIALQTGWMSFGQLWFAAGR